MSVTIIGFVLIVIFGVVFLIYTQRSQKNGSGKKIKEEQLTSEIKNSHKVMSANKKDIPQKDIADFMEFDKISDSMIVQNNGRRYTMVIQCKGINYDLMSDVEQMAVEEGFITFLNTLKYPIQLYVQARAVDLKENLNIYKKSVGEVQLKYNEINDKYRTLLNDIDADYTDLNKLKNEVDKQAHILDYAQDITRYVERISLNKSILQRKFYIVLSYNKDEIATTTDFSEQELYNICYRELYTRAQSLISSLAGCSVFGKVLSSNQLAELLYISYNRDDEKLLDIKAALDSGFYRLYSTSKDVFEKKEEAMQHEVEEEANRRVKDAIYDILKGREQKNADELVEEYEDRVDREALNLIDQSDASKEIKAELKSKIVENHVIGVETRKIDRKIKKMKRDTKESGNNEEKDINSQEGSSNELIKGESVIKSEDTNIIIPEEKQDLSINIEKKEDDGLNDDLIRNTYKTEKKSFDNQNNNINISNNEDEKIEIQDNFFDDRLGNNVEDEDSNINI